MLSLIKSQVATQDFSRVDAFSGDSSRRSQSTAGLSALLGAAAIFLGLFANERLLGFLFAADGKITGELRYYIRVGEVALVVWGLSMVLLRIPIEARLLQFIRRRPIRVATMLGFTGVVGACAAVELGFHAYNIISKRNRPAEIVSYSAPLWEPGVACESRKTIGAREIYNATYHLDDLGARVTPDSPNVATGRDIIFFGGSFTFGQGVEDGETLPNQVAQLAPNWRVTNLGFPGYGPAQMLERVQAPGALTSYTGSKIVVLDVFIPNHVRRAIGSMRIATTWGQEFPFFTPGMDDHLELRGTMTTGRPILTPVYRYLAREPILKCFNVDVPVRIGDSDLDLTARIDAETQARIRAKAPSADFRVVLFPDRPDVEFPAARIIPFLEAHGIRYLDYSRRLEGEEGLWIPGDVHPAPKTYAAVARWIAEDLGLTEFAPSHRPSLSFTD